jgi:hypothetical protein
MPVDIAPPEKHGNLKPLKVIEEVPDDMDRLPKIRRGRPPAKPAKALRCTPNIDVVHAFEAQ